MRTERTGPSVGVVGCLVAIAALVLPFLLYPDWGTALWQYYTGGALGVGGTFFLLPICVVVFLAGLRGRTDPTTAAGIALVLAVVATLLAASWALSTSLEPLFGFPASWITDHRWAVLGGTGLATAGAGLYAWAVL